MCWVVQGTDTLALQLLMAKYMLGQHACNSSALSVTTSSYRMPSLRARRLCQGVEDKLTVIDLDHRSTGDWLGRCHCTPHSNLDAGELLNPGTACSRVIFVGEVKRKASP